MAEDDFHSHHAVIWRGNYMHVFSGTGEVTILPDGQSVQGFVPDPDYVEPPEQKEPFNEHKVDGFKRTLFAFKVLFSGWECDEDAWVVELGDGTRAIVTTSHGATYVAEPAEFEEKLVEYEKAAADTRSALAMVKYPPP